MLKTQKIVINVQGEMEKAQIRTWKWEIYRRDSWYFACINDQRAHKGKTNAFEFQHVSSCHFGKQTFYMYYTSIQRGTNNKETKNKYM